MNFVFEQSTSKCVNENMLTLYDQRVQVEYFIQFVRSPNDLRLITLC